MVYLFVQGPHHIIVLADLSRCREQDASDRDRVLCSQLDPFASNLYVGIGIV